MAGDVARIGLLGVVVVGALSIYAARLRRVAHAAGQAREWLQHVQKERERDSPRAAPLRPPADAREATVAEYDASYSAVRMLSLIPPSTETNVRIPSTSLTVPTS